MLCRGVNEWHINRLTVPVINSLPGGIQSLMATVTLPNGRVRKVKNLGWLRRHWRTVDRIALHPRKEKNGQYQGDGDLFAYMKDGTIYSCVWADIQFAYRWINRPVLRGLPMTLYVNGSAYHQIIGEKNLDAIAKKLL